MKIENLAKAVTAAERKYKLLGMQNVFGLSRKDIERLQSGYLAAKNDLDRARHALKAESDND